MTHFESIFLAAIIILAYSFISIRLSKAVQPMRMRVIEDINALCLDPHVPDDIKADLENLSDNLFSKLNGWLIVSLFPVVMLKSMLGINRGRVTLDLTGKLRTKVTQTIGMGMFCMIATSPLCTVIFAIEFILSLIISAPWGCVRSLMRAVTTFDDRMASFSIFAK